MSTIEEHASELADNWRRFPSFALSDPPEGVWACVYTHNRDSDRLERSNAEVYERELRPFMESEDSFDVRPEHHKHFAVGWVDGFLIRVYDDAGQVTEAFKAYHRLKMRENDYPILDEERYSQMEAEELAEDFAEVVKSVARRYFVEVADDTMIERVDEWVRASEWHGVYHEEGWKRKELAAIEALETLGYTWVA